MRTVYAAVQQSVAAVAAAVTTTNQSAMQTGRKMIAVAEGTDANAVETVNEAAQLNLMKWMGVDGYNCLLHCHGHLLCEERVSSLFEVTLLRNADARFLKPAMT